MADYQNASPTNTAGSPGRYIPKAVERRQQPNTDWAELVRYQQAMAEQMIQQENEKRRLQKLEMNEALGVMMNQKQTVKRKEFDEKQNDYLESVAAKQNFDTYMFQAKNDRNEFQRMMKSEYDREKNEKNENIKYQLNNEMNIEHRIVANALDSLEKEKIMNQKKKSDWIQSTELMMREKELQKQKEKLMSEQNRQEHVKLLEENAYNLDMKDLNYKLYYQKINDKQSNRQNVYDKKVGAEERNRDRHLEDFVIKGVYDAKKKAEEEEMRRQMIRQEQTKSTSDNIKQKISAHEEEKYREKADYQNKVENLRRQNYEMQEQNNFIRKLKNEHTENYQQTLKNQMREAEELRKKQEQEMLQHEKKMHLQNFDGLIPGIRSSKFDSLINPQLKTMREPRSSMTKQSSQLSLGMQSPVPFENVYNSDFSSPTNQRTTLPAPLDSPISNKIQSPLSAKAQSPFSANIAKREFHNPITNPIPNNLQNPYIIKDFQKGITNQRTYLAGVADKNLMSYS